MMQLARISIRYAKPIISAASNFFAITAEVLCEAHMLLRSIANTMSTTSLVPSAPQHLVQRIAITNMATKFTATTIIPLALRNDATAVKLQS
jgi:hypothetical protein